MNPKALAGAAGGAVLGAVLWGVIAAASGYEVGFVAWAVGGLIGFGSVALGGGGATMGITCAVMAIASIFVGKVVAINMIAPGEIRKVVNEGLTREYYDEISTDAADFAKLKSADQYAEFMVTHGYAEAETAKDVPLSDVAEFKRTDAEKLKRFAKEKPSYEAWRAQEADELMELAASEFSTTQLVVNSLGWMDGLFMLLGVATAFKVGSGMQSE